MTFPNSISVIEKHISVMFSIVICAQNFICAQNLLLLTILKSLQKNDLPFIFLLEGGRKITRGKKRLSKSICVTELECETKIRISGGKTFKTVE